MGKLSKKRMADILGYEYCGKGCTPISGNEGYIIRKYGTTDFIVIGNSMDEAEEWLSTKVKEYFNSVNNKEIV